MKTNKKKVDIIINIIFSIGIVLCVLLITFKFSFMKVVVNGTSMTPSISDGAKGFMVKVGKHTKIERFDVVASRYDKGRDYYIIKRVLGLPNEEVSLSNNILTVNGNVIDQTFSFILGDKDFKVTSWTLAEDEYLLVGDNRNGTIEPIVQTKDDILAKNGFVYATYDIKSEECSGQGDYASCPIDNRNWYWFKDGK